jgi:Flp pilus assembly protein TadD
MTSVDLKPVSQSHSGLAGSSLRKQMVFLGLLLAVALIAVYYPVHGQPFANYDDADYVTDNLHVKAGLHWDTVRWALTTHAAANWHPVTWISHALDCQMFGVDPAGPHDVNLLLHLINALLLFWVLQRATGFVGRSWMVAALFALHPVNVESVAWIAERKNLLSMFFLLLTLAAYRWYARKPQDTRYLVVAVLFALGLMSKPQVITLPFILLLWDYWPLHRFSFKGDSPTLQPADVIPTRSLSSLIWEKVPLLALCGVSAIFTLNAQAEGGATSGYSHWMRLGNAVISYARYLGKALWPTQLALFYPYPLQPYKLWQVGAAAVLLLTITVAFLMAYRRRYLPVGWLWFLGTLVPMIGVIQVGTQAMADRYAYLPFVGLFIMICWSVADWAAQTRLSPMLLRGVSVAILMALALVAHRQVSFWNDHITLWSHVLEVTTDNWVAENNLGAALLKQARVEEAIPHFRAAAALDPTDPNSNLNIGTYEQMHGNLPAAIELYKKAATISRNPRTTAKAYNNLAYAYKEIHDLPDARESFQAAVKADPEFVGAWISLGLTAQRMGDLRGAADAYSQAAAIQPTDLSYLLLAQALEQAGDRQKAKAARHQAELLSNNILTAQHSADQLLAK